MREEHFRKSLPEELVEAINDLWATWATATYYAVGKLVSHYWSSANDPDAWVVQETPTGTKNGVNKVFTLAHTPIGTPEVWWGSGLGLAYMVYGVDYTYSGTTLTLITFAPNAAAGERLLVRYPWNNPGASSNRYGFFYCKEAHTSGTSTEPGVGASWSTVWEYWAGGGGVGPAGAAGATGGAGPAQVQQGRLTLSSGVPVPSTDVTSATDVYFTPYKGHYIGLYYDSAWITVEFAEESIALSGLAGYTKYDVFGYYDDVGEDLDIELAIWKQVQASNSPTSGSNKTINLADTAGITVGDLVTVRDGSNVEMARVTTVNTNTSIVVASLAAGYTTPYVGSMKTRATDLAWQDGVRVKSGDATRRYLGTILTDASAAGEDSLTWRGVFNQDNRAHRPLAKQNAEADASTSSSSFEVTDLADRVYFVVGDSDGFVSAMAAVSVNASSGNLILGLGLDSITVNAAPLGPGSTAGGIALAPVQSVVTAGMHFLQVLLKAGSGTATIEEGAGNDGGISGYVMA